MEEVVNQSKEKFFLRKVAMLIYILGPILFWYKIPFPVPLGQALILLVSAVGIAISGFNFKVLPKTFLLVFLYVCVIWCYNHNFELWTLFPPGGWLFFIFLMGLIGGVYLFDLELCRKYMRWVVWVSIVLFGVQFATLILTGSNQFCFVPLITPELSYEDMTYVEIVARHLASMYPSSIFIEKSYMAYYLVAYLSLVMFSGESRERLYTKETIIISLTLVLLRSGSGIVGLAVLWIVKTFSMFWTKDKSRRISMILTMLPFTVGVFYLYSSSETGHEVLSRQQELTTEETSGYARVVAGYMMYETLTPQEKMIGIPNARDVFGIKTDSTTRFYVNGVQTILLYLGYIGLLLYLLFYASVFRKVGFSSRMSIITLLTMSLLESNYLSPYMLLLTLIPCTDYYKNKLK